MTQTPKVEKKCYWINLLTLEVHLDEIKGVDGNLEVVSADYVSALETALKAARELISDHNTNIGDPDVYDKYQDALAKVDVK